MNTHKDKHSTVENDKWPQTLRKKRPRIAVRKAEHAAEELVTNAAEGTPINPQDRSLLKDHRDRTTGADQATREDMGAKDPASLVDTSDTTSASNDAAQRK
jgi:hypothetical protein